VPDVIVVDVQKLPENVKYLANTSCQSTQ